MLRHKTGSFGERVAKKDKRKHRHEDDEESDATLTGDLDAIGHAVR
jgi:hypothetical protein